MFYEKRIFTGKETGLLLGTWVDLSFNPHNDLMKHIII